jgi:Flp pilus assembly protein TadD
MSLGPGCLMPLSYRLAHLLGSAAAVAVLGLTLAACQTTGDDVTGSIGTTAAAEPRTDAEWRQSADAWGQRYRENPADATAAINYAKALRATEQRAQAVAVLEQASMHDPHDMALLGAYGRALADAGNYAQALAVLERAHTPDNPDWRILNAQGAVLDQLGRHTEARQHYSAALKIVPGEPSVLSNLGLSLALTKDLKGAEATLRQAMASPNAGPKVRQNLALIIGLEGRFAEAEKIASADLPPAEAAANVQYLRQLLVQRGNLKKPSSKRQASPKTSSKTGPKTGAQTPDQANPNS